jgi:putative DNA methylase
MSMGRVRKKLIEVALPLEAINAASAREKSIRHGHPSTLHLWWARRPLAAARAVIFAQLVDDPSANPDLFPTEKAQEKERQRLFRIIEELVKWENTTNESVLQAARDEIWQSWRRACAENVDHPRAKELFNRYFLPVFHDPFAGGGALPLEAQRLGLKAFASDLNPVSVLINKAMIEIPPKFAGKPPVNPDSNRQTIQMQKIWHGAQGLAEDVRYYGEWIRSEAHRRIGHLYPQIEITDDIAKDREDLKPYVGKRLTVIAWLWARTVKSPNPAFSTVDVPLVSSFMLGTKPGKEVHVEVEIGAREYSFAIKPGLPDTEEGRRGTKLARGANFKCVMSGIPIEADYIKQEGRAGRLGARLMAVVLEGSRGRVYISPTSEIENLALGTVPPWKPETKIGNDPRALWTPPYGLTSHGDLYTNRQLTVLTLIADLIADVRREVGHHTNDSAYCDAIATYLGLLVGRVADYCSTICTWASNPQMEIVRGTFARQGLPMTWDFAETNPFGSSTGSIEILLSSITEAIERLPACGAGEAHQHDAAQVWPYSPSSVLCVDPPYFDNIGYADLSDYFYVWLRRALRDVYPDLFATVAVPSSEELVANPYRHTSRKAAEHFFLEGMTGAMTRLREETVPSYPVSIFYAFRQSEEHGDNGAASTGWETFLGAVIEAGFAISGTWPVRTERQGRSVGIGTNVLASSIVLVCRPRAIDALTISRREFIAALKQELPGAIVHLQRSNIAPVDLAQAAIGPGMAVYTRFSRVLSASGQPLSVREALALINESLDEVLAQQEGDFDADTRWALAWFEHVGFGEGEYGMADTLSKAKNTSVGGMAETGILVQGRGKVRLVKPIELPREWDPDTDRRLTVWETVHQLIRALEGEGESSAAALVAKLGHRAEIARELAYRLYTMCERKKRPQEALSYNGLVQSWPEIVRLAGEKGLQRTSQTALFDRAEG